ncbi:MAG: hypothetical protein Q7S61_03000 [bacterium]|nr:hypothetical protein [bacterium]
MSLYDTIRNFGKENTPSASLFLGTYSYTYRLLTKDSASMYSYNNTYGEIATRLSRVNLAQQGDLSFYQWQKEPLQKVKVDMLHSHRSHMDERFYTLRYNGFQGTIVPDTTLADGPNALTLRTPVREVQLLHDHLEHSISLEEIQKIAHTNPETAVLSLQRISPSLKNFVELGTTGEKQHKYITDFVRQQKLLTQKLLENALTDDPAKNEEWAHFFNSHLHAKDFWKTFAPHAHKLPPKIQAELLPSLSQEWKTLGFERAASLGAVGVGLIGMAVGLHFIPPDQEFLRQATIAGGAILTPASILYYAKLWKEERELETLTRNTNYMIFEYPQEVSGGSKKIM